MAGVHRRWFKRIDWWLVGFVIPLLVMSILTMASFTDPNISFAGRQFFWIVLSFTLMFGCASLDLHVLKQSNMLVLIYGVGLAFLVGLIFVGSTVNGATSWYQFGFFSFQPSDLIKLILILILAKYLARRHVEIKSMKHLVITAAYFLPPFILIFLQPDFGTAAIFFVIWMGLILVAGISKRHLIILFTLLGVIGAGLWFGVLHDYQKERIQSFLNPLSDIQGAGYNAYQSTIAVGSGQLLGKGVGYGTQSRLNFLPEYQTDFIFAAVAEEWGFVGSLLVVALLVAIVTRILFLASKMKGNFELLFAVGIALYFMGHIIINIGMNIGLLPVTGVTLPFLSYGGSHLIVECAALGILMSFVYDSNKTYGEGSSEVDILPHYS